MKKIHGGDIYSYDQDVIDFSANINPLGIQNKILEAARESLLHMDCYPDTSCRKLRESIATKEGVAAEHIICGNGAAEIIFNLVLALRPSCAMFLAPTFAEYEQACDVLGPKKRYYTLKEEEDFSVDDRILLELTEEVDLLFLCNPNNPTGKVIEQELMLRILDHCENNNIFVVIDECFLEFTTREKELTMVPFFKNYQNVCIIKAFTKMYAMPGLRLGYGMTRKDGLIEKMYQTRQPWSVSVVAQSAGVAALELTDLPQRTALYVEQEREFLIKELTKRDIKVFAGEANYLLLKAEWNLEEQLQKEKILIRNCDNYLGLASGYFRIAVRQHDDNIRLLQAIDKIKDKI